MVKHAVKKSRPKIGKPKLRVVYPDDTKKQEFTPADREYIRQLHTLIDKVYAEAANTFEWTWSQLAIHAGLTYATVANLGDRQTKWPRFSTVWRLCRAVGWDLQITKLDGGKRSVTLKKKAS